MTNTGVSSMNFQWLFDRPIAHRGLHDEQYPENSMPAYEQAIAHNFNIEIDVHVSKDGEVVVFHDDNLKRVCGVDKLVKDCTVKELKSYPLANSEYVIPTFKEFLALVDGKVGILCEIKGINPFDHRIVREKSARRSRIQRQHRPSIFRFRRGALCQTSFELRLRRTLHLVLPRRKTQ